MVYLELFHGRKDPDEEMNDWGERGPIFGPFPFFQTTYASSIKFGDNCEMLHIIGDVVYYEGMYYGDWSVFDQETFNGMSSKYRGRLTRFEDDKAVPPPTKENSCRTDSSCN